MNVVREGCFKASVLDRDVEKGGKLPICLDQGVVNRPRQSVFDIISNKDSVEEVEKRLGSKIRVQLPKIINMIGHSGSRSIAALVKDLESPFAEHTNLSYSRPVQTPNPGVI